MGWRCTWQVTCERCQKRGPSDDNSKAAEEKAKKAGWLQGQFHGNHLHLCPECATSGLPDWWPDATGLSFHWEV